MTKIIGFLDAAVGVPNYDSSEFSYPEDMKFRDISPGYLNELAVAAGTGLQVEIESGGMMSKGRHFISTALETETIDPAASGYFRIDRMVVEFDITNKTIDIKISKGTEVTSSPSAPALVTGATLWEESLGLVNVDAATITSVDDDRTISGARIKAMPTCKVKRTGSTQTSGSNVEFDAIVEDESGMWGGVSNPDEFTIQEDGLYTIEPLVNYTTNATVPQECTIKKNGSATEYWYAMPVVTKIVQKVSMKLRLAAGDVITIPPPFTLDSNNYVLALRFATMTITRLSD